MICPKCGVEYSDKVCMIHKKSCKGLEKSNVESIEELKEEYTVEQLRELAKENGVKTYWKKREETLIEELTEMGVL